eukprot:6432425-Lingulodinium_polyedra.AAC.1
MLAILTPTNESEDTEAGMPLGSCRTKHSAHRSPAISVFGTVICPSMRAPVVDAVAPPMKPWNEKWPSVCSATRTAAQAGLAAEAAWSVAFPIVPSVKICMAAMGALVGPVMARAALTCGGTSPSGRHILQHSVGHSCSRS